MPDILRKSFVTSSRPTFDDTERSIVATITTDSVDRDGEVVAPGALAVGTFEKNPVVMDFHRYDRDPVGKCAWLKSEGSDVIAKTIFADTTRGNELYRLYRDDFLRGFSIGFQPDRGAYGPPTKSELESHPHWKGARAIVRKGELLEYSVCAIPVNRDALRRAIDAGHMILSKALLQDLEAMSNEPIKTETPAPERRLTRDEYLQSLDPEKVARRIQKAFQKKFKPQEIVKERLHLARGGV